jgi:hypothetical protein
MKGLMKGWAAALAFKVWPKKSGFVPGAVN